MEEFKQFYKTYEISNCGNVRRLLKSGIYKYLKCSILKTGKGYKYIKLIIDGKPKNFYIHHLVAYNFISERPTGLYIDHKDRDTKNNNLENLRYVSPKENSINTDKFRADVLINDVKERKKFFNNERKYKKILKSIFLVFTLWAVFLYLLYL